MVTQQGQAMSRTYRRPQWLSTERKDYPNGYVAHPYPWFRRVGPAFATIRESARTVEQIREYGIHARGRIAGEAAKRNRVRDGEPGCAAVQERGCLLGNLAYRPDVGWMPATALLRRRVDRREVMAILAPGDADETAR